MLRNLYQELPQYGTALKVEIGYVNNIVGRCIYIDRKFYPVDLNLVDISNVFIQNKYMAFLTYYQSQWWIYHIKKI